MSQFKGSDEKEGEPESISDSHDKPIEDLQYQRGPPSGQPSSEPPQDLYKGPSASKESEEKISQIQKQTDEVTRVMQGNVDQMLTRGEDMQDLTKQTETLQTSSQVFAENAAAVKKKLWWKNVKSGIIVAAIILLIIIAIVVYFVVSSKNKHKEGGIKGQYP